MRPLDSTVRYMPDGGLKVKVTVAAVLVLSRTPVSFRARVGSFETAPFRPVIKIAGEA